MAPDEQEGDEDEGLDEGAEPSWEGIGAEDAAPERRAAARHRRREQLPSVAPTGKQATPTQASATAQPQQQRHRPRGGGGAAGRPQRGASAVTPPRLRGASMPGVPISAHGLANPASAGGLAAASKLQTLASASLGADGQCTGALCLADEFNQGGERLDGGESSVDSAELARVEEQSFTVNRKPGFGEEACATCHGRGACADPNDPTHRQCRCAVLYDGESCEMSRELTDAPALKSFQGAFDGSFLMAQSTLKDGDNIAVSRNPAAEDPAKAAPVKIARVTPAMRMSLPAEDVWKTRFFRKCAIVGSSGILLTHELGAEIDSHDMVFRFNSASTKGFEKHVGSKTTHRITNSRNFGFRESLDEVVFAHMRNPTSLARFLSKRRRHPTLRFWGIHSAWHRYVDTSFAFLSTSGLFGILLALHRCLEPPNLYGFQVHQRHGVAYHYYDNGQPASEERDGEEWAVVKALAEAGVVRFRERCVMECHESIEACKLCRGTAR